MAATFFPATPARADASFVRVSTNKATGSAGTYTLSVTLSGTPTAGNLLIAAISIKNKPAATPTISGWTAQTSICASGNVACTYTFTKAAVGNETSVSASINSTGVAYSAIITVLEYSGAVNTFVGATTNIGTSSDTVQTGTVTPSRNGSLLFAIITQNAGTAYTSPGTSADPVTGWAKRTDEKNTASNALNIGYFDRLTGNTASTAYSISPTISGQGAAWSSIIFNFDTAESARSDIAITKSINDATPSVGDTVTYTITATNNGTSDNTGLQVTDSLPSGVTYASYTASGSTTYSSGSGLWNIGNLSNGSGVTLQIRATVNSGQGGNTIANTATTSAADVTDPTSGNNSASVSMTVKNVTATPVVTSPIYTAATSVSGTSTEANGTTITVYVNGVSAGTTTVSSNAWTKSVSALSDGNTVYATALASGKSLSGNSSTVTVTTPQTAAPTVDSPILPGATTVTGTSSEADGTTITLYVDGTSSGTTTVSVGVWSKSVSALVANRVVTAKALATNKSLSNVSNSVTVQTQSDAPAITSTSLIAGDTSITGTSTEANGTTITVYVNGVSAGTTTVSGGNWSKSVSALSGGDIVTAKATASGEAQSNASNSVTVLYITATPTITSPITAGSTSIAGTSSETNGTRVGVYVDGVATGTGTVSSGAWSLTVSSSTLQTGEVVTAKATASGKSVSATSSTVTVTNATSPIPTITSPVVAGNTSISGASSGANGTVIEVFRTRNSTTTSLGTTTVSGGTWTLSDLTSTTLRAGDTLTAKARIDTNNDGSNNSSDNFSSSSSSVTVITPVSPVPTVTSPIIAGSTSIYGTSTGSDGTPGTVIEVFRTRSGVTTSLGTTSVTAYAWTLSGLSSSTLQPSDTVYAKARIDTNTNGVNNNGDTWSSASSSVTVTTATSPVPTVNAGILAGDTSISGTSSGPTGTPGTTIEVFRTRSATTTSLGTATVSGGTWTLSGLTSSTLQTNDVITAKARVDTNNDGSNDSSDTYSAASSSVTVANRVSQAPSVNELLAGATSIAGTSSGPNGTVINIYVNGVYVDSTTVSSGTWSLSVSALSEDDEVYATATVDTNNDGSINGSDTVSAQSSTVTVQGLPVTAAPAINPPLIAKDTSITGTSTEANGTSIELFVDDVSIGTTTVTSYAWTKSISSSVLQAGETVTAKATATSKTVSAASTGIPVIALVSPAPVVSQVIAGDTSISGTSSGQNGTVIEVYRTRSGVTTSLGTGSVLSNAWTLSGLASSTLQTSDVITAKARIDTNNDGANNGSDDYSSSSSTVTVAGLVSEAPAVSELSEGATSISGTSTGANGTVIKVYVNGVFVDSTTVSGNTWTLSDVAALSANDQVTATATFDTNNDGTVNGSDTVSAPSSAVIVAGLMVTAAPAVDSPIVAGNTTISGTSSEANGTVIRVYVNSVLLATSSISVTSGAWSVTVTGSTLQAAEIVTATATATAKSTSASSTEITVLALTSPVPTVDAVTAGDISISGTSSAGTGATIEVFRQRGSGSGSLGTTTVSGGEWALSGLDTSDLQGGDVITAKARIDTNNDDTIDASDIYSSASSPVTVSGLVSDAPSVDSLEEGATSVTGTSTGDNGTLITLYVNNVFSGTGSVSGGTWTITVEALSDGDDVEATATFDTNNDGTIDGDDDPSARSSTVTVAGLAVSAVPAVNAPIVARATSITGTSSEGSGTLITVYVDSISIGTTTVQGGVWSKSISSSELQAGEVVTAKATADGKAISSASTNVTVQPRTSPAPTVNAVTAAATSISGTSSGSDGTVIEVFQDQGSGTGSLGTTTVTDGTWTLADIDASTLQADDIITAKARIDTNNDDSNDGSDSYSASSSSVTVQALTSPAPTVTTPSVGDTSISGTSEGANGTVIEVFRTRSASTTSLGTTTVSGGVWTLSDLSESALQVDDVITAKARIDTNNDGENDDNDEYSSASSDAVVLALASKDITAFSLSGYTGDITGTDIAVTVPYGTSVISLTPTIAINGVSISPASGVAQDFTDPVQYTVTAEDSSTQVYTVTVTVADGVAPSVVYVTPAASSTGVTLHENVVIEFSKEMDPDSFSISDDSSNRYTQTTWSAGNTIATAVHSPWRKGRSITVTIDGTSEDGLSLSGTGSYAWSFTTTATPLFARNIPLRNTTTLDTSGVVNTADGDTITINDEDQSIDDVTSGNLSHIDFSLTGRVSDQTVRATKAATLTSTGSMRLHNDDDLPAVSVEIPNNTTVYSGNCWDNTIALSPGSSSGTPPSGYSIGSTVVELGSACGILLLDQPITITLTGVTGSVGYKASGSDVWEKIETCDGTYDSPTLDVPTDPSTFGECSISDGADTKIVSYHLTTFGELVVPSSGSSSSTSAGDSMTAGGNRGSAQQSAMNRAYLNRLGRNHAAATSEESSLSDIVGKCTDISLPSVRSKRGRVLMKTGAAETIFRDVTDTSWSAPYISYLANKGIISGYKDANGNLIGMYAPNQFVTVAEVLKMALETLQEEPTSTAAPENRSAKGTWVAEYVARAEALKLPFITRGVNFHVPVTRALAVEIFAEVANVPLSSGSKEKLYKDVPMTHNNASAIMMATQLCWIEGYRNRQGSLTGIFMPHGQLTRAEAAKIVSEILERKH